MVMQAGRWLAESPRAKVELGKSRNKQASGLGNHCWGSRRGGLLVGGSVNNRSRQREEKDEDTLALGFLTHVRSGRERAKAKAGDRIAPKKMTHEFPDK